jgi:hypothetical protein
MRLLENTVTVSATLMGPVTLDLVAPQSYDGMRASNGRKIVHVLISFVLSLHLDFLQSTDSNTAILL